MHNCSHSLSLCLTEVERECLYPNYNSTNCTWYPDDVATAMLCPMGPTVSTELERLATSPSLKVKLLSVIIILHLVI